MIFRNIIFSAVLVGLVSGLIYGIFQQTQLSPIIYAAEKFEVSKTQAATEHAHAEGNTQVHQHNTEAWSPEDGAERIFWTMLANVLTGISFALVMLAFMALHNLKANKPKINSLRGIAWGVVGLLAIFVTPSLLGLRPEVPGTIAAALELRQAWWVFGVLSTIIGIAALYYLPLKLKVLGAVILVLPHILVGSSNTQHHFANTEPTAVMALNELTQQFVVMTGIGAALFFILLGLGSGFAVKKFVNLNTPAT